MVSVIFSRTSLWAIVPQIPNNVPIIISDEVDHNQFSNFQIIISDEADHNQQRNEKSNFSISISDRNCATVPRRPPSSTPRISIQSIKQNAVAEKQGQK